MGPRRCYFYDTNGQPIGGGCPRGPSCAFPHPDSSLWDEASDSTFRPSYLDRDIRLPKKPFASSGRGWYEDDKRQSRRDKRGRRSPSPRPRSRSRRRRDSIASSSGAPRDEMAQSLQNESNILPTPPTSATESFLDITTQKSTPVSTASPLPRQPRALRENVFNGAPTTIQTRFAPIPPPPPPSEPPPMQPPYPTPQVPRSLQNPAEISAVIDPKKKLEIWENRIKIFSDCVEARERFDVLDEELEKAKKVMESRFYSTLPDSTKSRLQEQAEALKSQRDEADRIFKEHQESLLNSESWPAPPPQTTPEELEQYSEILRYVKELNMAVEEVKERLGEFTSLKASAPAPLHMPGGESEDEAGASMMAVDQDPAAGPGAPLGSKAPLPNPDVPTRKDLNDMRDRLIALDSDIINMRNDLLQSEEDRKDRFQSIVDNKVEEIYASQNESRLARDKKKEEEQAATQRQLQEMNHRLTTTDAQVGELAGEIANLLIQGDNIAQEIVLEKQRKEAALQRVLEVERRLDAYATTRQTYADQLTTLKAALNAYTTRPPSPPASPRVPSSSYILQSLEPTLVEATRASVQPLVEELRGDIKYTIDQNNQTLYANMWDKIERSRHMIDYIGKSMQKTVVPDANTGTSAPSVPSNALSYPIPSGSSLRPNPS